MKRLLCVFALFVTIATQASASPSDDFAKVLSYVDSEGFVDYKTLQKDRASLDSYLDYLAETKVPLIGNKEEKLALLINAYNAFAIDGVLKRYPIKSVRKNFLDTSFFKANEHILGGKKINLDSVENQVRALKDPRIHFAIVCSSYSCPRLRQEVYTKDNVDSMLNKAATEFANNPKHVTVTGKLASVNPIMKWYRKDWGTSELEYLNRFRKVKLVKGTKIVYKKYNWSLNEQK